jgi:hypothetical protein
MIIKYFKDYIESISEGLITTLNADIVVNDVNNSFIKMGVNVKAIVKNDKIKLEIKELNNVDINKIGLLFDHIMSFIVNRGGWFPSTVEITNMYGMKKNDFFSYNDILLNYKNYKSISITFEAKFGNVETNIPDKLYHLTINEYSRKIRTSGLVPKSKSKLTSHLERIYLCKSIEECESLIPQMLFHYTGERDIEVYQKLKKYYNKDITPIIFEIDNSDGFISKIYKDPNYSGGYYTLTNIPKDKLKQVK